MNDKDTMPPASGSYLPDAHQSLINDPGDPQLLQLGWQKRFVTDESRVKEATQLYTEIGFEVRIEPMKANRTYAACQECLVYADCNYVVVYTRNLEE